MDLNDCMKRLNEWFESAEGSQVGRRDLCAIEDLILALEINRPLNKAQMRAVQTVLATLDCALEHGIRSDYLSDAIDEHLQAVEPA